MKKLLRVLIPTTATTTMIKMLMTKTEVSVSLWLKSTVL